MIPGRKTYVITFKKKEDRKNKELDKIEILKEVVDYDFVILKPENFQPEIISAENIVFDIDEYDAPVIITKLKPKQAKALLNNENILRVELDKPISILQNHEHNKFTRPEDSWGVNSIHSSEANNFTKGKGIKVAVMDTGIDHSHEQLNSNYKGGVSFVEDEKDVMDFNGHGTAIAGIIGSQNKEFNIGIAPDIDLYAIKIVNRKGIGNTSYILNALEWCIKNNIHVVNMSLGDSGIDPNLETMCNLAWNKGVLIVSAAGNNGKEVVAPAKFSSAIAVSAIDKNNQIYINSSRGPKIELCAPGVRIVSTLPGNKYGLFSGTSFACPHVTGTAGLCISSHRWPPLDFKQNSAIRRLLISTADKITDSFRNDFFGFGKVNAEKSVSSFIIPQNFESIP